MDDDFVVARLAVSEDADSSLAVSEDDALTSLNIRWRASSL